MNPALKSAIEKILKYYRAEEDDDSGCGYNGRWLSIYKIVELIKEVDNENDFGR